MDTNKIHIGSIIEQKVKERKMKISEFASLLNCCRTNVHKIFNSNNIDTERLFQISKILNFDFFSLFSQQSNPKISVKLEIDGDKINVIKDDR